MTQVAVGGRLHFGFGNLSLSHSRLYGGLGVALAAPTVSLSATPADTVATPAAIESVAETVCEQLGVDGVALTVDRQLPAHVGLGSGSDRG